MKAIKDKLLIKKCENLISRYKYLGFKELGPVLFFTVTMFLHVVSNNLISTLSSLSRLISLSNQMLETFKIFSISTIKRYINYRI